jgi:hypothetical protein
LIASDAVLISLLVREAVEVIREHLATWETPFVELDVFGTADPAAIAEAIDAFARAHLGAGVAGYLLQTTSVSSVHGVVLTDGRRVVIKAKPPAASNLDLPFDERSLADVYRAQTHLYSAGFPCPRPLLGPTPLGHGLATAETYLDGTPRDGRDPAVRRRLCGALVEQLGLLAPLATTVQLRHFVLPADRLFPQPHSKLFEPCEAEEDVGWVLDLGRRARAIAELLPGARALGHCDWRIEHVRFAAPDDDRITATYDWDSLAVCPEMRIVGTSAHAYTTDWSLGTSVPTYDEILAFIDEYSACRPAPLSATERRAARAWAAYWIAYGAWIGIEPGDRAWSEGWPALLHDAGERLLRSSF